MAETVDRRPDHPDSLTEELVSDRSGYLDLIQRERTYLVILIVAFVGAAIVSPYPQIAMWVGFMLAGYSAIANDSIQTIGTFIASNQKRPWWVLWLFIAGVFVATILDSWIRFDGDVSHGRLAAKGFEVAPTSFSYLQLAAPIFLLILTRLRIPVSTTFLILTCFATVPEGITSMLTKSLSGYAVAFVIAIIVWAVVTRGMEKLIASRETPRAFWTPLQWISTGFLWSQWIAQDAANIAVYLPRTLGLGEVLFFMGFIVAGLGLLFYLRGDRIQQIVTEKSDVVDVRSATVIDFIYALILWYFKGISNIPMSTTWVFLGLLAGRELAITFFSRREKNTLGQTFKLITKDVGYAAIGLVVSIAIAYGVNPEVVRDLFGG